MGLAYVSMVLIFAHPWFACGADCDAEESMGYGHLVFLSDLIVMAEIEAPGDVSSVYGMLQCTKPQAQASTLAYGESGDFTDKHFVGGC